MTNLYSIPDLTLDYLKTLSFLGLAEGADWDSPFGSGSYPGPIDDYNDHSGYDTLTWYITPVTWTTIQTNWEDAGVDYYRLHSPVAYQTYKNAYDTTQKQGLNTNLTQVSAINSGAGISSDMIGLISAANTAAGKSTLALVSTDMSDFTTATDARITAQKAANSGLATLDSGGKIPTTQLPGLTITSVFTAASQVAQLALTTQEGDVVVRSDTTTTYVKNAGTAGTMADFTALLFPTSAVSSFNSRTGAVSPANGDYNATAITNDSSVSGSTAKDALNTLLGEFAVTASSFTPTSLVGTGATGTQAHATKRVYLASSFTTQFTYSLSGNPASRVVMKICATNDSTEGNWIEAGRTGFSQQAGLAITVGQQISQEGQICFEVPPGWYYKFSGSGAGTHSEGIIGGAKIIYG